MTRALRCHRSYHYACRTQHTPRRPAHPDGAVDCVCERSVWCFEQQQVSRHTKHGWMRSPKDHETGCRPRVKWYMTRWGLAP